MKLNVLSLVLCFACLILANTASAQIIKPGPVGSKPKTTETKPKTTTSPQLQSTPILQSQKTKELKGIILKAEVNDASVIGDIIKWATGGTTTGGTTGGGNNDSPTPNGPDGNPCSQLGDEIKELINSVERGIESFNANCSGEVTTLSDGSEYDCDAHMRGLANTAMKLGMSLDEACDELSSGNCSLNDLTNDVNVAAEILRHCDK